MKYTIVALAILTQMTVYSRGEQCNQDQLDRCETAIVNILQNNDGYSQRDTESYCRNIYRRLHCVITQTSMCLSSDERQRKGPLIHKAWRFLASVCDGYSAWWRFDCFQQGGIKHCQSRLTDNRNVNYVSCRNYRQFRECATMVVKSRCSAQDEALLGIYLLDKGRERTWLCSANDPAEDDNHVSSAPLASGSDYHNDEDCHFTVQNEVRNCRKRAEEAHQYSDEKKSPSLDENCCIINTYEECANDIIKRYCGRNDKDLVDSFKREEFGNKKRCPDNLDCSNSASKIFTLHSLLLVITLSLSKIFFG